MSVSNDLHLAKTAFVTSCERVYAPASVYRNGLPRIHVTEFDQFAPASGSRQPCAQCKAKYQSSQIRIRRAEQAFAKKVEAGSTQESALLAIRTEYSLVEYEELALKRRIAETPMVS